MKRVVVTGLGCITPIGNSVVAFRDSLYAGRTGIATIAVSYTHLHWLLPDLVTVLMTPPAARPYSAE